jgi:glutathione S-transferase
MKLYQSVLSPFAARCRLQIYAKGLGEIELLDPPGGRSSETFRQLNRTGMIPALEAEGRVLGESEVICEYLEDRFPSPPMLPASPLDRAHVRLLSRTVDLYLYGPLTDLYRLRKSDERDAAFIEERCRALQKSLEALQGYMIDGASDGETYAVGHSLSLADCTLVPTFVLLVEVMRFLDKPGFLMDFPVLRRYWENIQKDPHCIRVIGEMRDVLSRR